MPTMFPAEGVDTLIRTGGSCRADVEVAPRFAKGAEIIVRNINPVSHTRLPQYVRGKRGIVEHDHGVFVFPDSNAQLHGETPQQEGLARAIRERYNIEAIAPARGESFDLAQIA